MKFSENLKKYRERMGFKSAKEFAKVLDIEYSTYMGYENRRREPKYEVLIKIADILNVSLDELLGRDYGELEKTISFFEHIGYKVVKKGDDKVVIVATNIPPKDYTVVSTMKIDEFIELAEKCKNSSRYKTACSNFISYEIVARKLNMGNFFTNKFKIKTHPNASRKEVASKLSKLDNSEKELLIDFLFDDAVENDDEALNEILQKNLKKF